MALQSNVTGSDVVQIRLDVALTDETFQELLDTLDSHYALWRLWDERNSTQMILVGPGEGRPETAGVLQVAAFEQAIVREATVRGYLVLVEGRLTVNADRFSVAEIGEIAQRIAFGAVVYQSTDRRTT